MQTYIQELQKIYQENADPQRAAQQKAYLKNKFEFYGLTTPIRRDLSKPFLVKQYLPEKKEAFKIIKTLWKKPQRELHHFAQELVSKYIKQAELSDIEIYEYMITHNSWWDTVDYHAVNLAGPYLKNFPEQRAIIIPKWMNSGNMWLQRTCIIFQLKYKEETNTQILSDCIEQLIGSKEFFINKAIGWALRQYSKTNPNWVIDFVENHPDLANLSKKEALKIINKTNEIT